MPSTSPFEYQLEMLKLEIDAVNSTIRQMDSITLQTKQWCVLVWTGAVGGALTSAELRPYVGLTFIVPLVFWTVDLWHRVAQRRFIWRTLEIMDFLNDERLQESFAEQRLVNFVVMDVGARRSHGDAFERFIDWRRVALFRTMSLLYVGLALVSGALALIVHTK